MTQTQEIIPEAKQTQTFNKHSTLLSLEVTCPQPAEGEFLSQLTLPFTLFSSLVSFLSPLSKIKLFLSHLLLSGGNPGLL
jgi:hypothetical protein